MALLPLALVLSVLPSPSLHADTARADAINVDVLPSDLGAIAQISFLWPHPFRATASQSGRTLELRFDQAFNAPYLGALRQRLGQWIALIDKQSHSVTLTASQDVLFDVRTQDNTLVVEMTPAVEPARPLARPLDAPKLTPPSTAVAAGTPPAARGLRLTRKPFDEIVGHTISQGLETRAELTLAPSVATHRTETGAEILFNWAHNVTLDSEVDGRELVLRLDNPVDGTMVESLAKDLPDWLESVSAGYDTILLVARSGVGYAVRHDGMTTRVALQPGAAATVGEAASDDVRLDILRARLKARQGDTSGAREALGALRAGNPENSDVLVELASVEESVGGWQRAISLYDRALSLDPDRRDIATSVDALDREHGSRVRIDADGQFVKDGDVQWIVRAAGRAITGETTWLGFRAENRWLDDDVVRRANGAVQAVSTTVQRGEIFGDWEFMPGHRAEAALLASAGGPGLGLGWNWRTPHSLTTLSGSWNRAYWELVEGLADDATQDAVRLDHEQRISRRWSGQVHVGLNRFGIAGIDTAATSLDLGGGVRYAIPWDYMDLSVGYSVDARYVGGVESRRDGGGVVFQPMPLTDTEIHSIDLVTNDAIGTDWRYSAFVSMSVDRFGGVGPGLGGELVWEPVRDVQMGLGAGHSRVSSRGDAAVFTRIGGHLLVRF
ncbi:MAG: hypothetical protein VYB54_03480 [Pseudomonadota bacterium]|nr:hypothetical protein [Pseudomonadota bacterium]